MGGFIREVVLRLSYYVRNGVAVYLVIAGNEAIQAIGICGVPQKHDIASFH